MIGHETLDFKSRIKIYAAKLVDYSWEASLVITFLFGAIVLAMFIFALAINYKLISPPPLLCHYMIGGCILRNFASKGWVGRGAGTIAFLTSYFPSLLSSPINPPPPPPPHPPPIAAIPVPAKNPIAKSIPIRRESP